MSKTIGPTAVHKGTPLMASTVLDRAPLMFTIKVRRLRKKSTQLITGDAVSPEFDKRDTTVDRIEWLK